MWSRRKKMGISKKEERKIEKCSVYVPGGFSTSVQNSLVDPT